jgi:hypothetical protein
VPLGAKTNGKVILLLVNGCLQMVVLAVMAAAFYDNPIMAWVCVGILTDNVLRFVAGSVVSDGNVEARACSWTPRACCMLPHAVVTRHMPATCLAPHRVLVNWHWAKDEWILQRRLWAHT